MISVLQDRSEYDLKEYSSLQKVLEQDELVKNADTLLGSLDIVKRNIIDAAPMVGLNCLIVFLSCYRFKIGTDNNTVKGLVL